MRCFTCNKVRVGGWAGAQHCSRALLSVRPMSLCSARLPRLRVVHTIHAARNVATYIAAHRGAEPGGLARASRRRNAGAGVTCVGRSPGTLGLGERDRIEGAR